MMNKDVDGVEQMMTSYCLLLPLVGKKKFEGEFTYVYSDWDVNGVDFQKNFPNLCKHVFSCNVLG